MGADHDVDLDELFEEEEGDASASDIDERISAELERAERRTINWQLSRAARGVEALRAFLWTAFVVGCLWVLGSSGWWTVAAGIFTAVTGIAAWRIRKRPFHAALVVAVLVTALCGFAVVVVLLDDDPLWYLKEVFGAVVLVVGCWWVVFAMRRAERLMRKHPDAFGTRRIQGRKRKEKGQKKTDREERSSRRR